MKFKISLCALFLFIPSMTWAATIYVDTICSAGAKTYNVGTRNCTTGSERGEPTINAGIAAMAGSDVLLIRGGTYVEAVATLIPTGTAVNRTQIRGYCTGGVGSGIGCESVMIRPTAGQLPPFFGGVFNIVAPDFPPSAHGDYVSISDFTVDGINGGIGTFGVDFPSNFGPIIERVTVLNSAHAGFHTGYGALAITIRDSTVIAAGRDQDPAASSDTKGQCFQMPGVNLLIEGNTCIGSRGGFGSFAQGVGNTGLIIRNNFGAHFGQSAINLGYIPGDPDDNCNCPTGISLGEHQNGQVYNNVLWDIAGTTACFHAWGNTNTATNIEVYNNTCHAAGYGFEGYPRTWTVRNNIFSSVIALDHPDIAISGGMTRTATLVNPNVAATFVNAANGDFHLRATATSAINQGMNLASITSVNPAVPITLNRDKDGNLRPSAPTLWDLGPYQFGAEPPPITPELVAAISCDNTVADDSGKNNNGSLQNGATYSSDGQYNQACQLDGINDHVLVADSDSLDFTTGFTLSAWVQLNAQLTDWADIITKANPGEIGSYWLSASSSAVCGPGGVVAGFYSTSGTIQACYSTQLTTEKTYVAATFDSTTSPNLRLYINGNEVTNSTVLGVSLTPGTGQVSIGSWNGTSEFLPGKIDNVRMYDYALPQGSFSDECIAAPSIRRDMNCPIRPLTEPPAVYGFKIGTGGSFKIGAGGSIKTGN